MPTKGEEVKTGVTHVPPGEGRSLWVLGELVTYKTTSERTGGAYSLFEVTTQPGGGILPHIQHREDESFYVLEGEYEFLDDGATMRVSAGSLLYIPRGNLHAYMNVGTTIGRLLVSQMPVGLHERFFEVLGEEAWDKTKPPAPEGPPDVEKVGATSAEYGIEIPPPSEGSPIMGHIRASSICSGSSIVQSQDASTGSAKIRNPRPTHLAGIYYIDVMGRTCGEGKEI